MPYHYEQQQQYRRCLVSSRTDHTNVLLTIVTTRVITLLLGKTIAIVAIVVKAVSAVEVAVITFY